MNYLLALVWVAALGAAEAEGLSEARRAYVDGLAAYDQALIEERAQHVDGVLRYLQQAQLHFARSESLLERLRAASSDADVDALLAEVHRAGRPCCGRQSLWDQYGKQLRKQ